jgi:hypothetical protein
VSDTDTTPGLQFCVMCGRMLTDRSLHDSLEQAVLAPIRAEHPEWVDANRVCELCIRKYRMILEQRRRRVEEAREKSSQPTRLACLIHRFRRQLHRNERHREQLQEIRK